MASVRRAGLLDALVLKSRPLHGITVRNSPVLAPGHVDLRRFTVVTGMHGAGKSYLLAVIREALPRWQSGWSLPPVSRWDATDFVGSYSLTVRPADGASTSVAHVEFPLERVKHVRQYPGALRDLTVTAVSSDIVMGSLITAAQDYYFETSEAQDVLRAHGSQALGKRDLEALGRITGHQYEELAIAIVDTEGEHLPLFYGSRGGREFTTFTMSRGEYSAAYTLWLLREAEANDVVLIDEPETFLAGPAHVPLIEEIGRLATSAGCQVIVATHSTQIIEHVPIEALRLVLATGGGAIVTHDVDAPTILRTLKRPSNGVSAVVFVEDELAARLVQAIIDRFATHVRSCVDVVPAGGEAAAKVAAKTLRNSRRLRAAVVLDADMRKASPDAAEYYLPGAAAPEVELLRMLQEQPDELATMLGVRTSGVAMACAAASLGDHHRAFANIASAVGVSDGRVLDAAISIWLERLREDTALVDLVEMITSLPTK